MRALAIAALLLSGCVTVTAQPTVQTTKQWEGHYFTAEDFKKGTESIQLGKNESVWVLSDKTLARVLKDCIQSNTGK